MAGTREVSVVFKFKKCYMLIRDIKIVEFFFKEQLQRLISNRE